MTRLLDEVEGLRLVARQRRVDDPGRLDVDRRHVASSTRSRTPRRICCFPGTALRGEVDVGVLDVDAHEHTRRAACRLPAEGVGGDGRIDLVERDVGGREPLGERQHEQLARLEGLIVPLGKWRREMRPRVGRGGVGGIEPFQSKSADVAYACSKAISISSTASGKTARDTHTHWPLRRTQLAGALAHASVSARDRGGARVR